MTAPPELVAETPESYTGQFLKPLLARGRSGRTPTGKTQKSKVVAAKEERLPPPIPFDPKATDMKPVEVKPPEIKTPETKVEPTPAPELLLLEEIRDILKRRLRA